MGSMIRSKQQHETGKARGRRLAAMGLAVAAVIVAAPATADASMMYVHSADSGELAGGRLTLHGVGRNVTWTTTSGRAGVERVSRVHQKLFQPNKPATGTLHIAGQEGGEELAFKLSAPRYDARRDTVSYRARPISKRARAAVAHSSAASPARSFGSASLSVVPHASIAPGGDGGNVCLAGFYNNTWYGMQWVDDSKWDTDEWVDDDALDADLIVGNRNLRGGNLPQSATWETVGGLFRGCANHTVWKLVTDPTDPATSGSPPGDVIITFNIDWEWTQSPRFDCTTSNPRFVCLIDSNSRWEVFDSQRP
jgi:hypothetical protein